SSNRMTQHRPQPSHRLSHSAGFISASVLVSQKGLAGAELMGAPYTPQNPRCRRLPPLHGEGGRSEAKTAWGGPGDPGLGDSAAPSCVALLEHRLPTAARPLCNIRLLLAGP